MAVKIILNKKTNLKNFTLIEGFPGIGLVGTIAAGYLIEKRKMEPIGYIYSDEFPPMTTIHQGKPYFPARIYKDKNSNFCVLLAEFVIPSKLVYEIAEEILRFVRENKIKQVISLAGMTSLKEDESQREVFGIASNDEMAKYLTLKKVKLINEGITTGVSGVLLAKCSAENFPSVSLLSESKSGEPDPRSAISLLEKLESVAGIKVDTRDLEKEANKIEKNMGKIMTQIRKGKRDVFVKEENLPMYQ